MRGRLMRAKQVLIDFIAQCASANNPASKQHTHRHKQVLFAQSPMSAADVTASQLDKDGCIILQSR